MKKARRVKHDDHYRLDDERAEEAVRKGVFRSPGPEGRRGPGGGGRLRSLPHRYLVFLLISRLRINTYLDYTYVFVYIELPNMVTLYMLVVAVI